MKLEPIKCPNCGAALDIVDPKLDSLYCTYCGYHIMLTGEFKKTVEITETYTTNLNTTNRKVNEAKVRRQEAKIEKERTKREIELKKLEMQQQREEEERNKSPEQKRREIFWIVLAWIGVFGAIVILNLIK